MFTKVKYFYFVLGALPLVAPISTSFIYFLTGLTLMIASFVIIKLGYEGATRSGAPKKTRPPSSKGNAMRFVKLLTLFSPLLSIYVVKFYTGLGPFDIFGNIAMSVSNYALYQQYFAAESLSQFGVAKIPAILSLLTLKSLLILNFMTYFKYNENGKSGKMYLVIASASHLYLSIGRGTSVELFEVLILYYYCANNLSIKSRLIFLLWSVLSLFVFYFNISIRSDLGCITRDICFKEGLISFIIGSFDQIIYGLVGYFSFGIFYTHHALINEIFSNAVFGFASFFPSALINLMGEGDLRVVVCRNLDCGVAWQPDVVTYVYNFGWLGLITGLFFCGRIMRRLELNAKDGDVYSAAALFIMFLAVISMPFSNVVTNSSSNYLSLVVLLLFHYIDSWPGFLRPRMHRIDLPSMKSQ